MYENFYSMTWNENSVALCSIIQQTAWYKERQ